MPGITYVNGKFIAQRTTGVQRVALQLVQALDREVDGGWVLLCPQTGQVPPLQRIEVRRVGPAGLPLHLWEQAVLPWHARGGRLLNLAGAAPAWGRRQWCMLHDAAVFDHPEAYTPAFVRWYRWLFRRLSRRALGLLTVSAFSRSRLAQSLGCPPQRLHIVPSGADHLDAVAPEAAALSRLGLQPQGYLLVVASANPTKNLPALLAAYALMSPRPAWQLVVVGGGNRRVFATEALADPDGVVRTGPLGDAPLKALYGQALGLVVPSLYEGFGLPPLEAMACGCPVIAAEAASLPEVCGDAADYFDPTSVPAMAAAMQRLAGDAAGRERLRRAGRRRVAQFRWEASARLLLQTLARPVAA